MTGSPTPSDPYATLGVTKEATIDQIKSAYKKLVLRAHPDKNPNASPDEKQKKVDEFHSIQKSYELLSDSSERQKYDRLQEVKADLAREREAARERRSARSQPGSQDYSSNVYSFQETRGADVYEIRVPRGAPRYYDDDENVRAQKETNGSSGRYEEPYRSSPRSRNEEFKSTPRRSSGRDYYEDVRKSEELEQKARKRQAAKKEEMKMHEARDKAKTKARRQESDMKSSYQSPRIGIVSDDSDYEAEHDGGINGSFARRKSEAPPKRRSDEAKRGTRSRKSRDVYESDSDNYYRLQQTYNREREAEEYIKSMGNKNSSDPEDGGRSRRRRNAEKLPEAPTPPPAPKEKVDSTAKRSSVKKNRDSSREAPSRSRKEKPSIEILDEDKPPRRGTYDSTRTRPNLKPAESAPAGSSEFQIPRSQTFQLPVREPQVSLPRRSHTSNNLEQMLPGRGRERVSSRELDPDRSSPEKVRGGHYGSPMVDDHDKYVFDSPATTSTRYKVLDGMEDDSGNPPTPRIVSIEPTSAAAAPTRRTSRPRQERTMSRETSPRGMGSTRRSAAASRGVSRSNPFGITRASTFQEPNTYRSSGDPDSPRIGISRASTARVGGSVGNEEMLFGEVREVREPAMRPGLERSSSHTTHFRYEDVQWAPPIRTENTTWSQRDPMNGGGSGGAGGSGSGSRRDRGDSDREGRYSGGERGKESSSGSRREKREAVKPYVSKDGSIGRHGHSGLRQQGVRAS